MKNAKTAEHQRLFGEVRGKKVYLDLVRENAEAFFSRPIEIIDVFDCDEKFAVRYLVGEMDACYCLYVREGKIAEILSYYHLGEKPTY